MEDKTKTKKEQKKLNNEEKALLEGEKINYEIPIDYAFQYSDKFYDLYVQNFEPGKKKKYFYRAIKRLFDIFVSFILILLLLIPFAIIAIVIKCDSKGPVIFKNRRVGYKGKVFNCLKFRSMATEAPSEVATSLGGTDAYITKVGKFLRKTSLDELPQLFNVFAGQMSLVGYRPLVTTEEKCNEMRKQLDVFKMRPGITGYSQVKGRDDVYYKNKAILDSYYVKNASLWFDFKIMLATVNVVSLGKSNWDGKKENEQK